MAVILGPRFIAAGFSGFASSAELQAGLVGGTAIASVVGGVGSVLGGGKFENGAETAAFGYLFNEYLHQSYGQPGHYTVDQLQGVIYNETSSLNGDGLSQARTIWICGRKQN